MKRPAVREYLLRELKETIFILVEIVEHVENLRLLNVVNHVVIQELVNVIGTDLAKSHPIDPLECSPWFKAFLL